MTPTAVFQARLHALVLAGLLACTLPSHAAGALAAGEHPPHTNPLARLNPEAQPWVASLHQVLPPDAPVRAMLLRQPQVQAAHAGIGVAQGRQARLAAGPHEWTVKSGLQQRRESLGPRYTEGELALERGLRLPGKQVTDQAMGRAEVEVSTLAFEDTWHESARSLLKAWFDWLREARSSRTLAEQAQLAEQQLKVVQRRIQAGEAARLEGLQAEAESSRAQAAWQQAAARERSLQADLLRRYPALQASVQALAPAKLPAPSALPDGTAAWVERVLADNHELELAEAQVQQAELQARRAGLDKRADPSVGVRASRERGGAEQVFGIYLSLPLGGAARQADEQIALAQAQVARDKAAEVRQRVSSEAWRIAGLASEGEVAWRSLDTAGQRMAQAAALAARAYSLGELPLGEALQSRRLALEAQLSADAARLDVLESQSRLLLDAHQMWTPPSHDKEQ